MAKKKSKAATKKKAKAKGSVGRAPSAQGKHLVIVESPTKAKTINKYLGNDYVVMASVGHVRDLPARAPKGQKQEVPGVDLEHDFKPTYEILPAKKKTVSQLKKAAKEASDVWFATDLDREGEAIAWHLAQALGVDSNQAKRVVFNAITKSEIASAFAKPRPIDGNRVNAQQARRILDRIVGYQVSPFLWKKVAGGLSAGRVQSVAMRLVVEREREIEAFIPDEYWRIAGTFATELAKTGQLASQWAKFIEEDDEGKSATLKQRFAWLSEHACLQAELAEYRGETFDSKDRDKALAAAKDLGFVVDQTDETQDPKGKGPARFLAAYQGHVEVDQAPGFTIASIATKRTTSKPPPPYITSTLQQAGSNRLGYPLQRTMRIAQQLYEGIDIHGVEGQTGLITYMRTDSTHLSGEALNMARSYIGGEWGEHYLPTKPNFYSSSNKAAQEAHEAIRPTDPQLTPKRVRKYLTDEQFRLYQIIWERFLASQMKPAEWDSTTILINAQHGNDPAPLGVFKANGRKLVFDGFYKAAGIPTGGDLILPELSENQPLGPMDVQPTQHFTAPPPRYTEASLQKKLEEEGIGRPSTYAAIIGTIQNRKYVEPVAQRDRRLRATDLGKVVTDMLTEAFPKVMDVAYTRRMETELDKVEDEHHDWVTMLREFYGPFKINLEKAHEQMTHAKAVTEPAPHKCPKCGATTMYRFGKNGRFLSCSTYPECDYAAPIDQEGNPLADQLSDIVCPIDGKPMVKRTGRFGPFLASQDYPQVKFVVNLDAKKGTVKLPKPPPLETDVPCPKCGEGRMNVRRSKRGPWLSCNRFPKCRGRVGWSTLDAEKQEAIEAALEKHEAENPVPVIKNTEGKVVDETYVPQIVGDPGTGSGSESDNDAYDSDAA